MARPKEKLAPAKTKSLIDRCSHEKGNLKQGVIKQLQKDLEGLLDSEIHFDLTIRAEGRDINIHKFILRSRSQAIYERLTELSTGNDPSVLIMPSWLSQNTVLFVIRKLYFVETDPLDEAVDQQDEVLMDYLKSLLVQHNISIKDYIGKNLKQHDGGMDNSNDNGLSHQVEDEALLGVNGKSGHDKDTSGSKTHGNEVFMVVNDDTVDSQTKENDLHYGVWIEENVLEPQGKTDSEPQNSLDSKPQNRTEYEPLTTIETQNGIEHSDEINESEGVDCKETNLSQVQCSFSDMIKLSYGLSVPYEACNRVGEDLLKGYLQEIDTDCEIVVSDVHFKAHKCILCARSSYFAAMLGGSWRETDIVNLEGVTPNVIEQMLLYLYGGVVDIISCTVDELIMSADMYGLQGINEVVISFLKREYCHMFHKLCSGCEERLPEALSIAITFHIDPLRDKCVDWVNRNMLKMWRSKHLAKQPQDVLDYCYRRTVEDMNRETAIDLLMKCENLNSNIPRISWSEPLLCNITKVQDAVIEFISCNFISIINSASFDSLDKGLGYKISLLQEIFEQVIKSLPINKACEVYRSLSLKQSVITALEINQPSEDFVNFINFLVEKCESFLKKHVHQVIKTEGWSNLSKDTQSRLLEGGSFVLLNSGPSESKKGSKPLPTAKDTRKKYPQSNPNRRQNKTLKRPKTQQEQVSQENEVKNQKVITNPVAGGNMISANTSDNQATLNLEASSREQDPSGSTVVSEEDGQTTVAAEKDGILTTSAGDVASPILTVKNGEQQVTVDTLRDETEAEHQNVVLADLPEPLDFVVQLIPVLQFTFHTPE